MPPMLTPLPPTIRALREAFARLDTQHGMSAQRARQYKAVLGELTRASDLGHLPETAREDMAVLLSPSVVQAFLDQAEAGRYRSPRSRPGRTATSTNRTRVDCLNRLSAAAGHPLHLGHRTPAPPGKPVTTVAERRALRVYLRQQNNQPVLDDDHARILVIIGLALDTGARAGELAAARLRDLSEDHSAVRLRRNPQRAPGTVPLGPPQRLSPATRTALERWLTIRAGLVSRLREWTAEHPDQGVDGYHDHLFVSLTVNHSGRRSPEGRIPVRPAGVPLRTQGLIRAHNRAAARINADRPWHRPLPSMEQLRRVAAR